MKTLIHQIPLRVLVAAIAFAAPAMASAGGYEDAADLKLKAGDLAPAALLQGARHNVDQAVTFEGGMPRFTIRSQYGTWQARGREMLEIRVSELPAFEQINRISKTDEFGKAAGKALAAPVDTIGQLIEHPVDTAGNIVSGIGIMAGRFGSMVGSAGARVGDTVSGDTAAQKPIFEPVAASTGTAGPRKIIGGPLGYNQKRREWAQQLKVDAYTSNAVLSDRLGDLASASFAGSFPVNATIGVVAAPLSYSVELNQVAQLEAAQFPPLDIETRNEARLKKMGIEGLPVRTLFRNSYFTPTLQTSLVLALESLGNTAGRVSVVEFAGRAASEIEARYVINSVTLLAQHGRTTAPVASVRSADNVLAGTTGDGKLIIPVPLDYIPWAKPVDEFARRTDLTGSERWVLVAGKVSPHAMKELAALNWRVAENRVAAK